MRGWCAAGGHRLIVALLFGSWLLVPSAAAQELEPLSLDDILLRLESNLHEYDTQVPSFLCDEHVVSQILPNQHNNDTVTDSVFRLKHVLRPDHSMALDESRDVKTVNGHPAQGAELDGPSLLSGAFSGGLAIVSLSQKSCMTYKLRPVKPGHSRDPYVVQFATLPDPEHLPGCLLQESGSGRVFIDPESMQITRMELTAPHHLLTFAEKMPDGRPIPSVFGVWDIKVDYSSIQLGGRSFWMPSTITSDMTAGPRPTIWSFKAHYSNYHKLEVTSRIVPSTEEPAPDSMH